MFHKYKKMLAILTLMLMLSPAMVNKVQASTLSLGNAPLGDNTLTLGTATVESDTSDTLDITLNNQDAVASGQIEFTYDTANGVTFTAVNKTSRTTPYSAIFSESVVSGTTKKVTILFYDATSTSTTIAPGSGTILELAYTTSSTASGTTTLNILKALLSDSSFGALDVTKVDGAVTIGTATPVPTLTPTLTATSIETSTPTSTTSPLPTPTATIPVGEAIISVNPISTTIGQTDIFTVAVNITSQEPVYGYQINCEFDPTILQHIDTFDGTSYVDVVNGGFIIPDLVIREKVDNGAGTLSYAISLKGDKSGSEGSGTLIELPFYGLSAGVSAIDCSDILLSNADAREIPAKVTNGEIKVSNSVAINFPAQIQLRDNHEGIQACIGDVCERSNADGDISFTDIPPTGQIVLTHFQHLSTTIQYTGTPGSTLNLPTAYLLVGDLDQDGDVDIVDIGIIANAFTSIEGNPHWNALADVTDENETGDNRTINIFDMVGVARNFNQTAPSPWNYNVVQSARRSSPIAHSKVPAATVSHVHTENNADADTSVVLSPSVYESTNVNEEFEITINFEDAVDVQSVHLQIQFDETKLAVLDCDPRTSSPGMQACIGDFLDVNNQFVVLNDLVEPGKLEVAITQLFPATPQEGNGQYATIRFTTIERGTSEITLSKVHIVDDAAPIPQDVPAQAKDSMVSVPFYGYLPWIIR